jgi:hypothetical protein
MMFYQAFNFLPQDHFGHDTDSVNSFDAADELLSLCRLDHRVNTEDVDDVFLNSTSNECSTSKSRLHPFSEASNSSCLKVSSRSRSASNSSRRSRRARNTLNTESNKDHNTTPKTLLLTTDDSLKRLLSTWAEEQIRQFQDEIDDTQIYENDLFLSGKIFTHDSHFTDHFSQTRKSSCTKTRIGRLQRGAQLKLSSRLHHE